MIEIEGFDRRKYVYPWDWDNEDLTGEMQGEIVKNFPEYASLASDFTEKQVFFDGFCRYSKVINDYFNRVANEAQPPFKQKLFQIAKAAYPLVDGFTQWVVICRTKEQGQIEENDGCLELESPNSFTQLKQQWNAVLKRLSPFKDLGWKEMKHPTVADMEIPSLSGTPQNGAEGKVQGSNGPPSVEPIPVDETKQKACAGSKWFDVTLRQMEIIKKLNENPGAWVSGASLKSQPGSEERPDQIIKRLPAPLFKRIESRKGVGYGYRLI